MTLSREEAEQLLPFLANGTLEGDELIAMQEAVAQDPSLAAELSALRAIRQTMQSEEIGTTPGEFGLARLMRDVGKEEQPASIAPQAVTRSRIWQIAAALLMAVVIGQAVLLSGTGDSGGGFELAGAGGADLTVAFAPDAPEAAIRTLLLDAGVEIIGGPSALGLYQLQLLEGASLDEAEGLLRAAGDIVESVDRAQ